MDSMADDVEAAREYLGDFSYVGAQCTAMLGYLQVRDEPQRDDNDGGGGGGRVHGRVPLPVHLSVTVQLFLPRSVSVCVSICLSLYLQVRANVT
jgi:hypothetical protein